MKVIKTAVIGSGFMGVAHIEALRRIGGVDLVAIASDDEPRARHLADQFDISVIYTDWKEAINNREVQVIHNCTPNHLHFEINKAAILAGKHIISEKPLTLTSGQAAELLKLLESHNVVNAINFNYRMYPLIQQARQMVVKGDVGDVYLVHGHYLQDWLYYDSDYNWRLETELSGDSRAVADIGSHWCDMAQFVTGLKIKRVFADLSTFHRFRQRPKQAVETFKGKELGVTQDFEKVEIKTEDAASVLLQFENGARGAFTVSQVSAGRKNRFEFEIDGSKKALAWNQEEPNQLWIGHREKSNEIIIKDPSLMDSGVRHFANYPGGHPEGYPDGFKNMFANVYNFIREGKNPRLDKPEFPTFADGHWENRIVEAVLESHRLQKWVEVL